MLVVLPIAIGVSQLAIARQMDGSGVKSVLYIFAVIEILAGLGALILATYWTARLVVSVRAGKLGYLGGETETQIHDRGSSLTG